METNQIKIDRSKVVVVYTGKQACMCGCKGKYRTTEAMRDVAGKRRGYEITDAEVNENFVTRVINQVMAAASVDVGEVFMGEQCYSVDDKDTGRRIAVYVQVG